MPTKPRIDLAGYHHVINRGVNRCDIFNNNNDKDMFLQILNKTANIHEIIVHTYCLIDNHYHLLIETKYENLSVFIKNQREEEKPKHKIRAKVEHSFALIKTTMQQSTTRFIGLVRNNMNFTITCIAANLKLFAHKKIKAQKVRIR